MPGTAGVFAPGADIPAHQDPSRVDVFQGIPCHTTHNLPDAEVRSIEMDTLVSSCG